MRKTLLALLAAIPAAILAGQAQADDPPGPGPRGGPGMLFQRLDKNNDGEITLDEVPEAAPQFVKDMLKKADKNDDKVVTTDELRAAAPQIRPGPPSAHRGPRPDGRPEAGPHAGPPQRPEMDPKAIFVRLDRNKDRQLSPEEFAMGMRAMHSRMQGPGHPTAGPPAGRGRRAEAGPSRSPRGHRPAMDRSHGRRPMDGVHGRSHGMRRPPMASHGRFHRGMNRPPMAFHGGFRGAPHRAMGSRPPFDGLGRPFAPWQGHFHGVQRFGHGPQGRSPVAGPGARMASRLKEADKNDDGKISKSEAPEKLKQNFDRVDADKDGQLDRAEMAKAAVAVRKKFAADVADKRREAFAKRVEAGRKARAGAERRQPEKAEAKKAEAKKAAEKKPVEKKTVEKKSVEKKSAEKKSAEKKAVEKKVVEK